MTAVNYTQFRDHMKSHMDEVTDNYDTLIITRKGNKNVVMISESTYNNMLENIHVRSSEANYKWLLESKAQWKAKILLFLPADTTTAIPENTYSFIALQKNNHRINFNYKKVHNRQCLKSDRCFGSSLG